MADTDEPTEWHDDDIRRLYRDLPYPPEFTRAFGEVMIEFASLERDLFDATADIATNDFVHAAILLAGIPYSGLVDRFCALGLHLSSGKRDIDQEINRLRLKLLDVSERRNHLIHFAWLLEPISGSISRIRTSAKGKSGLRFDTPIVPTSELTDLKRDIISVRSGTNTLAAKFVNRLPPEPHAPPAV